MTVQMIHSPWIGEIEWDEQCEIHFPHGLPGFENERRFLPVEIPAQRPLVYLQSVENHAVCFLCLPVLTIDPAFALELSEDDHAMLRFEDGLEPELGRDVLCLGLLAPLGRTVETDLRTPIVINLHCGLGVQAMGMETAGRFRLSEASLWEPVCS